MGLVKYWDPADSGRPNFPAAAELWPNIPAGFTEITTQNWTDREAKTGGWDHIDIASAGTSAVVSATGAPGDTPHILRYSWVTGADADSASPAREFYEGVNHDAVYFGTHIKLNADFHGHTTGGQKFGPFIVDEGSTDNMFVILNGTDSGPLSMRLANNSGSHSQIADPLNSNEGDNTITRDTWHKVEWLLDRTNGLIRMWLDGSRIMNYTGQVFDNTAFGQAKIDPVWGGQGDSMPSPANVVEFGITTVYGRV